mgnify:CR=1 FL=1
MRTKNLKENGITLIALIITIIILLILAGVSISIVVGDNGILNQAVNGADRTNIARELEMLQMAVSGSLNEKLEINGDNLKTNIENGLGNNDFEFTDNGDGSYKAKINSSDRLYYIEENGNIISPENMIEMGTADELKAFRDEVNSGNTYDGYYISLTSDITLDINEIWEPIGLYPMESATPDAETNKPFSGVFDGNGHEIDGIYINTTDKVQGLFGIIRNGKITNLKIGENCNITGGTGTAGTVGYIYDNSIISNCYNQSNINGSNTSVGGVVAIAYTNCSIINIYNTGDINNLGDIAGGLVAYADNNIFIQNSYNKGDINSQGEAGGILGHAGGNISINKCYNKGDVVGISEVGGMCGNFVVYTSKVNQSYNSGSIQSLGGNEESGNSNVGGIVGLNSGGSIIDCYNIGTVTGINNNVGGIIGLNRGTLENSYNIGIVSGSVNYIGGIVGNNDEFYFSDNDTTYIGEINNSYSLEGVALNLYGTNDSIIGEECSFKTSSELQGLYTILGSAFIEDDENINNGYPILIWQ